jgi:fatty acid desaturase
MADGSATLERLLSPAELKALSARRPLRGAAQLALHLALIALGTSAITLARGDWWLLAPAMLLQGWLLASLFAPAHETAHYTVFESRRANEIIGWFCGLPTLLNWHYYQLFHFAHHRHTQDSRRDPELSPPAPTTRRDYLWRLTALPTWFSRLRVLLLLAGGKAEAFGFVPAAQRPRLVASARLMLAGLALVVGAAAFAGRLDLLALYWLGPVLLAMPLMRAYLLAEHTGCSEDANGLTNTRTTRSNAFMRATMWNMPFHAEHHLFPSIPFHALPAVHARIGDRLAVKGSGYARVTLGLLRSLPR